MIDYLKSIYKTYIFSKVIWLDKNYQKQSREWIKKREKEEQRKQQKCI